MTAPALKLSDLAGPDAAGLSDVAVFVRADGSLEGGPFALGNALTDGRIYVEGESGVQFAPPDRAVRRLGRGRLEPARIVMEGEADLATQVATLRAALAYVNLDSITIRRWIGTDGIDAIRAALAATAPKPTEENTNVAT